MVRTRQWDKLVKGHQIEVTVSEERKDTKFKLIQLTGKNGCLFLP